MSGPTKDPGGARRVAVSITLDPYILGGLDRWAEDRQVTRSEAVNQLLARAFVAEDAPLPFVVADRDR